MKTLSSILILACTLTLIGCGEPSKPTPPPPPPEPYIEKAEMIKLDDFKEKKSIYITKFKLGGFKRLVRHEVFHKQPFLVT